MHILQLTDFYRPVIGGLEIHVETLAGQLVAMGHRATVVTLRTPQSPQPARSDAPEIADGVRIERLRGWAGALGPFYADRRRPFHPPVPDPGLLRPLHRIIERERPDVVLSHSWIEFSNYPLYRAATGPAHVATLHDYGLICAKKTYQYFGTPCTGPRLGKCASCARQQYGAPIAAALAGALRAGRPLLARADAYVAVSEAVADAVRPHVPPGPRLEVISSMVPDGLDELAHSAPRPAFLPPDDGYLLYVGALSRHKGVDVLLDAVRLMRHRVPLVLIGMRGPDTASLELSGPGIIVACDQPKSAVMASWAGASVGVVPSVWGEPHPLVPAEGMLAGRPVVASAVGGLGEIVDDRETGLLVPPRDPPALAAALDTLLDDPARRERMGQAGRRKARAYEARTVTPQLLELFTSVLDERADRARAR
ncbi:glycosyltransferase family 4 protein [Actinospica robiniae]|uniref:glycosyltransferase family 4 protein n=1 Tax=Actinospica robiniae TaxID=304901 RepID=UPI0004239A08|nr:glycosyltransferase family 4 protein [Actinospica robiniae]